MKFNFIFEEFIPAVRAQNSRYGYESMGGLNKKITFLKYADGLRVFSIIAVIMLHSSAVRVANWPQIESVTWWVAHALDSMCRWPCRSLLCLAGR